MCKTITINRKTSKYLADINTALSIFGDISKVKAYYLKLSTCSTNSFGKEYQKKLNLIENNFG